MATETITKKLFTTDEYRRILDAGIFPPDQRFELIRGEIIEMPKVSRRHAGRVNRLTRLFVSRFGESAIVSVQNDMYLDEFSQPRPDMAVCKPLEELFGAFIADSQDVFFLVEISDTSIRYDTKIKTPLYAKAGIREYWILDINEDALIVLTEPIEGEYRRQETFRRGETIHAQALPDITFSIDELLG
jgi:Uma2 family endonuclease